MAGDLTYAERAGQNYKRKMAERASRSTRGTAKARTRRTANLKRLREEKEARNKKRGSGGGKLGLGKGRTYQGRPRKKAKKKGVARSFF